MDRYNFKVIERARFMDQNKLFNPNRQNKKSFIVLKCSFILLENTYGPCKKLYNWRCSFEIQNFNRIQCFTSNGMGSAWYAAENAANKII